MRLIAGICWLLGGACSLLGGSNYIGLWLVSGQTAVAKPLHLYSLAIRLTHWLFAFLTLGTEPSASGMPGEYPPPPPVVRGICELSIRCSWPPVVQAAICAMVQAMVSEEEALDGGQRPGRWGTEMCGRSYFWRGRRGVRQSNCWWLVAVGGGWWRLVAVGVHLNLHSSGFPDVCALYSPFLHQLTMYWYVQATALSKLQ